MSKVIVKRPWGYFGCIRKLNVLINSKKIGQVKTKENFEFEVDTGKHEVQVSMDWCKSKPLKIEVNNNEELVLSVKTQTIFIALFACFILPSKVFSLHPESKI